MNIAVKISLLIFGLFLLNGMLTGICKCWKIVGEMGGFLVILGSFISVTFNAN